MPQYIGEPPNACGGTSGRSMPGLPFDLDALHVRVFEAYTDVKGKLVLGLPKGDKKRTLDLVPVLVDELRVHVEGKPAAALVFTAATGGTIRQTNWNKRVLHPAGKLAGLISTTMAKPNSPCTTCGTRSRVCARRRVSHRGTSLSGWATHPRRSRNRSTSTCSRRTSRRTPRYSVRPCRMARSSSELFPLARSYSTWCVLSVCSEAEKQKRHPLSFLRKCL